MKEFFNKYLNIKKIKEEKYRYHQQMNRVKALPEDYQFVFKKIQENIWYRGSGDDYEMMELHYDLIDLFEEGLQQGKSVLEVTGEDVAGFVEELLKSVKNNSLSWQEKLNREISKKLKGKYD